MAVINLEFRCRENPAGLTAVDREPWPWDLSLAPPQRRRPWTPCERKPSHPVCGELLILGKSVIRHTQAVRCSRLAISAIDRARPANRSLDHRYARAVASSSGRSMRAKEAASPSMISRISTPRRFIRIGTNRASASSFGVAASRPSLDGTGN